MTLVDSRSRSVKWQHSLSLPGKTYDTMYTHSHSHTHTHTHKAEAPSVCDESVHVNDEHCQSQGKVEIIFPHFLHGIWDTRHRREEKRLKPDKVFYFREWPTHVWPFYIHAEAQHSFGRTELSVCVERALRLRESTKVFVGNAKKKGVTLWLLKDSATVPFKTLL